MSERTAAFSGGQRAPSEPHRKSFAAERTRSSDSGRITFCQPAQCSVMGRRPRKRHELLTSAYFSFPDFTRIPVATRARCPGIWFAIPNKGQRIFTPPFGSITPMLEEVSNIWKPMGRTSWYPFRDCRERRPIVAAWA